MNPWIQQILTTVFRNALVALGVVLVQQGLVSETQWQSLIPGAAAVLAGLAWSLYEKYVARLKLLTAQALPAGVSEQQVERAVETGNAPSVSIAKDETVHAMSSAAAAVATREKES